MFTKPLLVAALAGIVTLGVAPAHAAAGTKPVRGCALLSATRASKILGAKAHKTHGTNKKDNGAVRLWRGCTYSSSAGVIGYTATTYSKRAQAKSVFSTIKAKSRESTSNSVLMGADNVKIKGHPGFARQHRLIPGEGEPEIVKDILYQVVVRKGSVVFATDYAAGDLDSIHILYAVAKVVVPRM